MAIDPCVPQPHSAHPSLPVVSGRPAVCPESHCEFHPEIHPKSQLESHLVPESSLYQHIAQLELRVQQQQQRQQLINHLIRTSRNNHDLGSIYEETTAGLVNTLKVDRGLLLLFKYADPRQRHRTPRAVSQASATIAAEVWTEPSRSMPVAETAVCPTDRTRSFAASDCGLCQPLLLGLPEVVHTSDCPAQPPNPIFQVAGLPTYLLLPLESQGMVLGAIVLQQAQPRVWLEDEVEFVRLIATQLSNAIIQTRSFQQVQAVVQERTAQLRRSLEVQAKLYEKTRQQVEQLRRLNEEREEFLSTISHELLTPLTSMILAIRMLRQGELDGARRGKYLDILEQQCTQETHLINDMLALRKLEMNTATTHLQKLDLHQMIQDVLGAIETRWREKDLHLSLNLPAQLLLYSDRDSFHRILLELLTNAKKYSEPSSTIELTAHQEGDLGSRQTILSVRNVGAGIAPDELPHIFEKFRRGRGVTQQAIQGTGLGLALVKSLVEHLEGTITATSSPVEGDRWETCFTVRLPHQLDHCVHAIA